MRLLHCVRNDENLYIYYPQCSNNSTHVHFVSDEITQYCIDHSTIPSKTCREIEEYTKANVPMSVMLTGPLEGSLLGFLIGISSAKRVLEIGCYTGYSALAMAERLPDDGELITLDINPETDALAKSFWKKSPHGKKIQSILGPALETLETLSGKFDVIFIDAVKKEYPAYLEKCLRLLSSRGVIAVDNCLYSGMVLETNPADEGARAIQSFNRRVAEDKTLECTLLPIRDGVFLIRKIS